MRPAIQKAKSHFNEPISAVEVGVDRGDNALSILQNVPIRKMYLIDPYVIFFEKSSNMGRNDDFPKTEFVAKEKLEAYKDKCIWLKQRSDEVNLSPVDFVYVDGSHEYENVINDLDYFWSILNPGGILSGHDWQSPGVRRAVQEFSKKMNLKINLQKPDWWFEK